MVEVPPRLCNIIFVRPTRNTEYAHISINVCTRNSVQEFCFRSFPPAVGIYRAVNPCEFARCIVSHHGIRPKPTVFAPRIDPTYDRHEPAQGICVSCKRTCFMTNPSFQGSKAFIGVSLSSRSSPFYRLRKAISPPFSLFVRGNIFSCCCGMHYKFKMK
ncbi:hypothetical protein K402DRAFT_263402 [Aulographum hederae CBS 113979]|uniref:Uncharacterized protein n=1 Tax=Aulographum hederae CBS 113979 TaxID=1176131 RepID=A0A6G1H9S0_9PEZI|nr:hypothetical protein K402DRAFT_263402 [Aulographum hederae CBS 113979]